MPVTLEERTKFVRVRLEGMPSKEDYDRSMPKLKEVIVGHEKTRLLIDLDDFMGWDLASRWDKMEFNRRRFDEIEKVALVGDRSWENWMTGFLRPFRHASVRFFGTDEDKRAKNWLSDP